MAEAQRSYRWRKSELGSCNCFCVFSWWQVTSFCKWLVGGGEETTGVWCSVKKSESSALLQLLWHFPYNENLTRALNTTSLKWCLPSTDAIGGEKKNSRMCMKVHGSHMQVCFIEIHQVFAKKSDTFLNNENLTRALNTISLKYCLPSTDAIDRWEKIHAFI